MKLNYSSPQRHVFIVQVGNHPSASLDTSLASRQLEVQVGQLGLRELEGEPQHGGGQCSLGLRRHRPWTSGASPG